MYLFFDDGEGGKGTVREGGKGSVREVRREGSGILSVWGPEQPVHS